MLKTRMITVLSIAAITMMAVPAMTSSAAAQVARAPLNPNNPPCTAGAGCNPRGGASSSTYQCGQEIGYLKRVYEDELAAIDLAGRVAVVPVCENEQFGMLRADGNAGALRTVIAQNDAMMEALNFKAFGADDVIGIRMTGDDSVTLYVHPFHHR